MATFRPECKGLGEFRPPGRRRPRLLPSITGMRDLFVPPALGEILG